MPKIGESTNEFGTPVSVHTCEDCGSEFTVCPPADDNWGGCQVENCRSYDFNRDADRLFDRGDERIVKTAIQ